MGQHHNPDDLDHQDLDDLGRPIYHGDGLSVRELSAEELQRFLDAHTGQPAQRLGSGWATLNPSGHPAVVPRTPRAGTAAAPAEPITGSHGRPGRSALLEYRRRRALELAAWTHSLAWRAPLVAAAGLVAGVLAGQAGLSWPGLAGLAVAALMGWRLRFRPSERARAWQRGAHGEQQTARLLDRLGRDGYPSPARLGHSGLPRQHRPPRHRPKRAVRDRLQAVDRPGPPGQRRTPLAQQLPPEPHSGHHSLARSRACRP